MEAPGPCARRSWTARVWHLLSSFPEKTERGRHDDASDCCCNHRCRDETGCSRRCGCAGHSHAARSRAELCGQPRRSAAPPTALVVRRRPGHPRDSRRLRTSSASLTRSHTTARRGDASVIGIEAGGVLRFSTSQPTQLRVGTLLVLPGGTLEVGTAASPVPAAVTRADRHQEHRAEPSTDPDQFGTGLLSIDGTVTLHGAVKTPTFVRTAAEPRAGQSTIIARAASHRLARRGPDLPSRHPPGAGRPLVQSELRTADRRANHSGHQRRRPGRSRYRHRSPSITGERETRTARRRWSAAASPSCRTWET